MRARGARWRGDHGCFFSRRGRFRRSVLTPDFMQACRPPTAELPFRSSQSSQRLFGWCHLLQDVGCTKRHAAPPSRDGATFEALATRERPQSGRGRPGQGPARRDRGEAGATALPLGWRGAHRMNNRAAHRIGQRQ